MSEETSPFVLKKECRDQKLERVVVFNDRAELKRLVECELKAGMNEIHVENVSQQIMPDTVRVDGRGDGILCDVQVRSKAAVHEETDSPKLAQLRTEVDKKSDEVNSLEDREITLKRRHDALNKVIGGVGDTLVLHPKRQKESFALEQETLDNLKNFFAFYEKNSLAIRAEQHKVEKDLDKAHRELSALQQQLGQELCCCRDRQESRSIIITLESEKGGPVELLVSYQVRRAFWNPSYDIRVETGEKKSLKMAAAAPAEPYALSTEFTIAKPAAIPSDGAEHKVTIGIIDVEPLLVHECVPSKNKSAFLTASALIIPINLLCNAVGYLLSDFRTRPTSSYLLLFQTFLKNISPGERFSCSLGVDTALRVEYKPARKYHEQTGLLTKSSSTVNDQLIIVKNSRADPVLLTVKEPIPRSTDEKIRVGCLRAF
ncbi:hypothetical protein OESDEN_14911 [Oesophagostomum dentatum]|uniref:DUF4140 domain-containing protein n=1 Tax=Oesophagostomum dentatum TaxID=61180 RepID=A0A0B1SN96_OESDE|nr:hypothetical protein OESDEN_14911 [Oesophagostomum dentatum]